MLKSKIEKEEEFKIKCIKPITYCEDYKTEACRYICDYSIKIQNLEKRLQNAQK